MPAMRKSQLRPAKKDRRVKVSVLLPWGRSRKWSSQRSSVALIFQSVKQNKESKLKFGFKRFSVYADSHCEDDGAGGEGGRSCVIVSQFTSLFPGVTRTGNAPYQSYLI
ncbi:hypothetical protein V1477_007425 [Vespula maculifrons]|uniref:Uncharacterized protein n=1 Tax=Vespula maculifrons TaxID=7453 RepID=A0ABD2CIF5_VESMC